MFKKIFFVLLSFLLSNVYSNTNYYVSPKNLVPENEIGTAYFGSNGEYINYNIIITGSYDDNSKGASWIIHENFNNSTKILPDNLTQSSYFGSSIDCLTEKSTCLFGAPGFNTNQGAAWIGLIKGGNCTLSQQLQPAVDKTSETTYIFYGQNVQFSKYHLHAAIAGTTYNDNLGRVWLYKETAPGNWEKLQDPLDPNTTSNQAWFGKSIIFSDDGQFMAIGATVENYNDIESIGAVYIYKWDNNIQEWIFLQKIFPTDIINTTAEFGTQMAFAPDSSSLVIGAYKVNNSIGAAYVYDFDGENWLYKTSLTPPKNALNKTYFGSKIKFSNDSKLLIISGYNYSDNTEVRYKGIISVYQKNKYGEWDPDTVKNIIPESGIQLGTDFDLWGSSLIIAGAPFYNNQDGAVLIYKWDNANWNLGQTLESPNKKANFGSFVKILDNGNMLLVGGPNYNSGKGSATLYYSNGVLPTTETTYTTHTQNPTSNIASSAPVTISPQNNNSWIWAVAIGVSVGIAVIVGIVFVLWKKNKKSKYRTLVSPSDSSED